MPATVPPVMMVVARTPVMMVPPVVMVMAPVPDLLQPLVRAGYRGAAAGRSGLCRSC